MADRITISYQDDGSVKFKVRKQFKDHKYQFDKHWEDRYTFKLFGIRCSYSDPELPSKEETPRKLKVKQYYPHEYAWYLSEPKWWRKLHHIEPLRRANKEYCYKVSELYKEVVEFNPSVGFELVIHHPYYGLAEPLFNKPHEYYW